MRSTRSNKPEVGDLVYITPEYEAGTSNKFPSRYRNMHGVIVYVRSDYEYVDVKLDRISQPQAFFTFRFTYCIPSDHGAYFSSHSSKMVYFK